MKKLLLLMCFILCSLNCSGTSSEQSSQQSQENDEWIEQQKQYFPSDAKFIKQYSSKYGTWILWKLENRCFLTYNLSWESALLTQTTCDDEKK